MTDCTLYIIHAATLQEWKVDTLCDLYETLTITQAIIYCSSFALHPFPNIWKKM